MKQNSGFTAKFIQKIMNGYPMVFVHTYEYERCMREMELALKANGFGQIYRWNKAEGFLPFCEGGCEEFGKEITFPEGVDKILQMKRRRTVFIMRDLDRYLRENPEHLPHIEQLVMEISSTDLPVTLVVVSTMPVIPPSLSRDSELLDFPLPEREQIISTIESTFANFNYILDQNLKTNIADALAGLTEKEIRLLLNTIITTSASNGRIVGEEDIRQIIEQKKEVVRKTGVIELVPSNVRFEDVGGLDNLKRWIKLRKPLFEDPEEAQKNGLRPPKGILLFGVPGSGKSLTSKMVANYYNMPLLALSMGQIFSHESPATAMLTALATAEAIAPCVLWIDEVEKMFAGAGMSRAKNAGNSGEIGRVFGILLTWMQENEKPVFLSVTSNDISNLEPTLYRDGRISERFFVGFIRTSSELRSILDVHFRLRLGEEFEKIVKPLDYDLIFRRMQNIVQKHRGEEYAGYSGANVEALVEKTLERRYFINKEHIETKDIIAMLAVVKPQHGPMIKEMQDRAKEMDAQSA